jgi:hypothetical protein
MSLGIMTHESTVGRHEPPLPEPHRCGPGGIGERSRGSRHLLRRVTTELREACAHDFEGEVLHDESAPELA